MAQAAVRALVQLSLPLVQPVQDGADISEHVSRPPLPGTGTTGSITVAGSKDAVAALEGQGGITLAEINLATIKDKDERTFAIPLGHRPPGSQTPPAR